MPTKNKQNPIYLNIYVYYDEKEKCNIAHCLDFDLLVYEDDDLEDSLIDELIKTIKIQLIYSLSINSMEYIFRTAPDEYYVKFGKALFNKKIEKTETFTELRYDKNSHYLLKMLIVDESKK
jgi:hypothetical protein